MLSPPPGRSIIIIRGQSAPITVESLQSHRMDSRNLSMESGEGQQPSTATSRSLIDRVKAGDEAAWDRLVGLYGPLVYRWCRQSDLPDQELADIFQDVFQAVATHIASFRK